MEASLLGSYVKIAVIDCSEGNQTTPQDAQNASTSHFSAARVTGDESQVSRTSLEIVREHGGAMNVQSVVGAGSTFEVWLPRIEATAPTSDERITKLRHSGRVKRSW